VLTESMLAWATPLDPTGIHVLPLDASGDIATPPIRLAAGDIRSPNYQLGSLSGDGRRLAWSARGKASNWYVYSWSLGEADPRRLSRERSGTPRGPVFSEQNDEDYLNGFKSPTGLTDPVVSGDRVSWRQWRGLERAVLTWKSRDSSPTVLARYSDPDYATLLCASGDRVAWVVETNTDEADEASLHSIVTWEESEAGTQTVAVGGGVDSEDSVYSLSVNADRMAFDGNFRGIYSGTAECSLLSVEVGPVEQAHPADGQKVD